MWLFELGHSHRIGFVGEKKKKKNSLKLIVKFGLVPMKELLYQALFSCPLIYPSNVDSGTH